MDQKILKQLLEEIGEIKNTMVTKDYLDNALEKQREEITKDTDGVIQNFIVLVDEKKATKEDVNDLDKRIAKIERKLAS